MRLAKERERERERKGKRYDAREGMKNSQLGIDCINNFKWHSMLMFQYQKYQANYYQHFHLYFILFFLNQ